MKRPRDRNWGKRRLRRLLGLFFLALVLPTAVLSWQAYSQLKWESFHRYQVLAEELVGRIDDRFGELVEREEIRAFTDYGFLVVEGAPAANYLQRSPLSGYPVSGDIPGLLGYFQIDAQGRFTTPLLPDGSGASPQSFGITSAELAQRQTASERLLRILSQERLVTAQTASGDTAETEAEAAEMDLLDSAPPVPKPSAPAESRVALGAALAGKEYAAEEVQKTDADELSVASSLPPAVSTPSPKQALDRRELKRQKETEAKARTARKQQKLAQAVFDRLADDAPRARKEKKSAAAGRIGRVDELKLERIFTQQEARQAPMFEAESAAPMLQSRAARRERNLAPAPAAASMSDQALSKDQDDKETAARPRVRMFESELDPFEFGLLESGHLVLYRKVWRQGQRIIQGALIETGTLIKSLIEEPYRKTALSGMSRLAVAYEGEILSALGGGGGGRYLYSAEQLAGTLLYRSRVAAPLSQLELVFTVTRLPPGAGAGLVTWVVAILALVLSGGLVLIYRVGVKQIELNRQQQDFVSAISHELKTPLTSIRMYSEMLRAGWADESRRHSYYDFIHEESERLSRLITNVLQLARMSRNELPVEPRPLAVDQLLDVIRSKLSSQIERAGFEMELICDDEARQCSVEVDEDAFIQVLINLVDNAIKFSAKAERRRIEIRVAALTDGHIRFSVRDYGPGIPRNQLKKIFRLFYRSENELTRETMGTGIGLALVQRLVTAMDGSVDVVNREPGAEFQLRFPLV